MFQKVEIHVNQHNDNLSYNRVFKNLYLEIQDTGATNYHLRLLLLKQKNENCYTACLTLNNHYKYHYEAQ